MKNLLTPVFADGGSLLFFLLFAIFGLIKFLTAKKEGAEDSPAAPASADEERRTREIQEEIRRRIAENMRKASAPSAPTRSQPQKPELHPEIRTTAPRPAQPARVEVRGPSLMERLATARREEEESQRRIETTLASIRSRQRTEAVSAQANATFTDAAAMLKSGAGLRESVILAEILAGPVSDRSTPSCPGLR